MMSGMTETRSERLNALVAKWARQAQRLDDYRGILMCMKDVEEALRLTEVVPPAEVKAILKQGTDLLVQLGGKPFVPQIKDVIASLNGLCVVTRAMNMQVAEQQKTIAAQQKTIDEQQEKINTLSRELEVALMPKSAPSPSAKVVNA